MRLYIRNKEKYDPSKAGRALVFVEFPDPRVFSVGQVKEAKEFGLKMKGILPAKDGKFVSYFESWKIPRNKGGGNMDEWSSLSSKSESPNLTEK